MPKWPVSFIDGSIQVADADGTHYPIFMQGAPVTMFSPGWAAISLQTGLAPFHVLELRHEAGHEAYWMLDTALEYRANAVAHLAETDRQLYLGHVEPLVRNLFEEAVLAPHAAIPAAAHEFDGFLDGSVADLIRLAAANAIGTPDVVSVRVLADLGGGYTRGGVKLPTGWIEPALRAAMSPGAAGVTVPAPGGGTLASQETLALHGHAAYRYHDRASGLVFYLLAGADPLDRHLYVPQANAVFTVGDVDAAVAHDPLGLLLLYYATHTDRAVMLPEAEALHPVQAPMAVAEAEPAAAAAMPTVMPAPPTEWPSAAEPTSIPGDPAEETRQWAAPWPAPSSADDVEPTPAVAPMVPRPLRQNWWQRLLGLGQD